MIIHNIRKGFATNSSSTHSFIFMKGAFDDIDYSFGWENFVAASYESKKSYLAGIIHNNLRGLSTKSENLLLPLYMKGEGDFKVGEIDHQSVPTLPKSWFGITLDEEFLRHFKEFFFQEDLVILGGNDNDENTHPLGPGFSLPMPDSREPQVCRWDPEYKYWTLFNRSNGNKVRFQFEALRHSQNSPPRKAFAPELVDLKITEICNNPTVCKGYCYQGSSPKGKHCDLQTLEKVAETLASLKVFEVALGGGEPLEHPQFLEVLRTFRRHGIVPSFSTRRTDWLEDPEGQDFRKRVFGLIGAVGFSINTKKEVKQILSSLIKLGIPAHQVKFHYVMGSTPLEELSSIIHFLHTSKTTLSFGTQNLLLLGYKNTGTGRGFSPYPYDTCVEMIKGHKIYRINADTAFLQKFKTEIEEICPRTFLEYEEGKFSCYIDPIKGFVASSSFAGPEKQLPFDPYSPAVVEDFKKAFQTF